MDEEMFISEVEKHKLLYDPSDKWYKDVRKKDAVWKEVAKAMCISDPEICKTRWKSIRDTFVRNWRKIHLSGSGGNVKEWKYTKILSFLLPFINQRKRNIRGEYPEETEYPEFGHMAGVEDTIGQSPGPSAAATATSLGGPAEGHYEPDRKKKITSDDVNQGLFEFLKKQLDTSEDEDEIFCRSLAAELKKVRNNKGHLKVKLLSLIVNWDEQQSPV